MLYRVTGLKRPREFSAGALLKDESSPSIVLVDHNSWRASDSEFVWVDLEEGHGRCVDTSGILVRTLRKSIQNENIVFLSIEFKAIKI